MDRRRFALLWLGAFAFFLSFLLLLGALPIFARRLGASDTAVGVLMGSFRAAYHLLSAADILTAAARDGMDVYTGVSGTDSELFAENRFNIPAIRKAQGWVADI